jgi:hypothetical protein
MVVFTCAIVATVGVAAVFRAVDQTRYIFYCSAALGPLMLVLSVAGSWSTGAVRGVGLRAGSAAGHPDELGAARRALHGRA